MNWLFGSKEEGQNRFSRLLPWQPSWISNQNNFSYFLFQAAAILPIKFQVSRPSVQEKKLKIDFQDCGHLGFTIGRILAIFYLKVSTKFWVSWPFVQQCKIYFHDDSHGSHLGFQIWTILAIFLSAGCHDTSYPVSSQLASYYLVVEL